MPVLPRELLQRRVVPRGALPAVMNWVGDEGERTKGVCGLLGVPLSSSAYVLSSEQDHDGGVVPILDRKCLTAVTAADR